MKKITVLMILASLMAVFGCKKDQQPEELLPTEFAITFGEENITESTISVQVTPSVADKEYYASIITVSEYEGYNGTAALIEGLMSKDGFAPMAGQQTISAEGLNPSTEYVAVAFELNQSEKVFTNTMKTLSSSGAIDPENFSVAIKVSNITATSATVEATPSDNTSRYFFRVITKMELDAFGIYNNDLEIFKYICENPSSGNYIVTGTTTRTESLNPETDWIAIAFNYENYQDVLGGITPVRLFREEFSTPKGETVDPNSLFTYSNLQVTYTGFTLDVVPVKGEDKFWAYYIWTKESYDETLANEASNNVVMRSYFGLNNIAVEQGYSFGEYMKEYLGQYGTTQILNYEHLKNNTEYVVVMFYMDENVSDPTDVYDYNYVAVEFKTLEPSADSRPTIEVGEPVITPEGFGTYAISFNVKTSQNTVALKVGTQYWSSYDFAKYWDPNDWSQIQAFFLFRQAVSASVLEQAKTPEGATVSITGLEADEYAFFFEALNENDTAAQFGYHLTADKF